MPRLELCISRGASGSRGTSRGPRRTTAAPSRAAISRRRLIQVAPGDPALGHEGARCHGEPVEPVESLELFGDRVRAGHAVAWHAARGVLRARRRVASIARGSSATRRRIASTAARSERRSNASGSSARRTCARPSRARTACWCWWGNTTRQPIAPSSDARPRHVDMAGELIGQLVAEHRDDLFVVGVEHESDRAQAQTLELLIIEIGELGDEGQEQPERLQVAREDQALVAKHVQPAAQGRDLGRQALQLGARRAGVERASVAGSSISSSGSTASNASIWAAKGRARRGEPHVPPRRPAPRLRPRTARRRSPRGRAGEALRPCDRRWSGGR